MFVGALRGFELVDERWGWGSWTGLSPDQYPTQVSCFVLSLFNPPLNPSSALEQIKTELREVSDHVKSVGRAGSNEDTNTVSELMDDIRDVVTNYRVSGGVQAVWMI